MTKNLPTKTVIETLKAQGKLGDSVRVKNDGTILLRARTIQDGYKNYLRVRQLVMAYRSSAPTNG